MQVAPLAGGAQSDGFRVELVLLVDRGLVESFLNRYIRLPRRVLIPYAISAAHPEVIPSRAVISSFVSEIMVRIHKDLCCSHELLR